MPIGMCNSPSSGKLRFATDSLKTLAENHNLSKCRVVEPRPNWYSYSPTPAPRTQDPLRKRGREIVRTREIELAVTLCLLEMWESPPGNLTNMMPMRDLNKDYTNTRYRGNLKRPQPRQWILGIIGNRGTLRAGGIVFPREQPVWLHPIPNRQSWSFVQGTLFRLKMMCLRI